MIYVNSISKYKQLSHHHTKQVIEIRRAHTRAQTHMQSPHGYPMRLTHAHTQKITRAHTHVHPYMQSSRGYPTHLMHATKQTNRINQYQL